MRSMKSISMIAVALILVAGAFVIPLTISNVYAKDIVQHCDAKTLKCEFDTTFKKVNGDVNMKQSFDFSGLVSNGSGGGSGGSGGGSGGGTTGNYSGVDQVARDRITVLENQVANLQNTNDAQDNMISALRADLNNSNNDVAALTTRVNEMDSVLNNHTNEIASLKTQFNDVLTDVDGSASSGGGTINVTVPEQPTQLPSCAEGQVWNQQLGQCVMSSEPEPQPPISNESTTGGNVTEPFPPISNNTGSGGGSGDNNTGTVPPIDNNTINEPIPPINNETQSNTTTSSNVTTIDNGTGTIVQNETSVQNQTNSNTSSTGFQPSTFNINELAKQLGF